MNSRLSHLVTAVLAATCGVLLLGILMFQLGLGRGYSWLPVDDAQGSAAKRDELNRSTFKLASWEEFAEVNEHPLFNEDRKPSPPAPPDSVQHDGKPIPKLSAVLSGVVINDKVRMVMIKPNGKGETTTVREGGALPGDLGAWSLVRVEPRKAIFKNVLGEDAELELIATGNGQKPPQPAAPGVLPHPAGPGQPAASAMLPGIGAESGRARPGEEATELQRRIEARRQQMREERARVAPQSQPPKPAPAQQQHR